MKNFLARLDKCRNGMSVSAFSRLIGMNQKTVDLYTKGERKPSVELVVAVCKSCGCSADWLLGLSKSESLPQEQLCECDMLKAEVAALKGEIRGLKFALDAAMKGGAHAPDSESRSLPA